MRVNYCFKKCAVHVVLTVNNGTCLKSTHTVGSSCSFHLHPNKNNFTFLLQIYSDKRRYKFNFWFYLKNKFVIYNLIFIDEKIDLKAFKCLKYTRKNKNIFLALTGMTVIHLLFSKALFPAFPPNICHLLIPANRHLQHQEKKKILKRCQRDDISEICKSNHFLPQQRHINKTLNWRLRFFFMPPAAFYPQSWVKMQSGW